MKSLKESILSSNNVSILSKVKDNIKYCNNVEEFSKLWTKFGLDIDKYPWKYAAGGGYVYIGDEGNRIFCMPVIDLKKYPCIFIYDDPKAWTEKFDIEKYVKMVSKTLDMTYDYSLSGWYELKFK